MMENKINWIELNVFFFFFFFFFFKWLSAVEFWLATGQPKYILGCPTHVLVVPGERTAKILNTAPKSLPYTVFNCQYNIMVNTDVILKGGKKKREEKYWIVWL